jgi:hypothetical protein
MNVGSDSSNYRAQILPNSVKQCKGKGGELESVPQREERRREAVVAEGAILVHPLDGRRRAWSAAPGRIPRGGQTLGQGLLWRAHEIKQSGGRRRARMASEEARARVSLPEAEREAAYGRGRGGREKLGIETKQPPTEMTSRTHALVERRVNRR